MILNRTCPQALRQRVTNLDGLLVLSAYLVEPRHYTGDFAFVPESRSCLSPVVGASRRDRH